MTNRLGLGGVGDQRLAALEEEAVALAAGGGAHGQDVGAGGGLGHAHGADVLAGEGPGEVAGALGVVAGPVEVVDEEHRVGEVREGEAGVALRQLVVDDDGGRGVHAGAAVLGRDGDAEEAELAAAAEQGHVEGAVPVVLLGLGLDGLAHEVAHHLAEHAVLFGGVFQLFEGRSHRGREPTSPPPPSCRRPYHGRLTRRNVAVSPTLIHLARHSGVCASTWPTLTTL